MPEWIGVSGSENQAQLAAQIVMPRGRQWTCVVMNKTSAGLDFGHQHRWCRSPDAPNELLPKTQNWQLQARTRRWTVFWKKARLCVLVARLGREQLVRMHQSSSNLTNGDLTPASGLAARSFTELSARWLDE